MRIRECNHYHVRVFGFGMQIWKEGGVVSVMNAVMYCTYKCIGACGFRMRVWTRNAYKEGESM